MGREENEEVVFLEDRKIQRLSKKVYWIPNLWFISTNNLNVWYSISQTIARASLTNRQPQKTKLFHSLLRRSTITSFSVQSNLHLPLILLIPLPAFYQYSYFRSRAYLKSSLYQDDPHSWHLEVRGRQFRRRHLGLGGAAEIAAEKEETAETDTRQEQTFGSHLQQGSRAASRAEGRIGRTESGGDQEKAEPDVGTDFQGSQEGAHQAAVEELRTAPGRNTASQGGKLATKAAAAAGFPLQKQVPVTAGLPRHPLPHFAPEGFVQFSQFGQHRFHSQFQFQLQVRFVFGWIARLPGRQGQQTPLRVGRRLSLSRFPC